MSNEADAIVSAIIAK
jgi:uncharacterized protein (TIGR02246 family)